VTFILGRAAGGVNPHLKMANDFLKEFAAPGRFADEAQPVRALLSVADVVAEALFAEVPALRLVLERRQIPADALGRAVAVEVKAAEMAGRQLTPIEARLMLVWRKAASELQGGSRG
jgi:hypothetical protein